MSLYVDKKPKREMTKKYIQWVIDYSLSVGGVTTKEMAREIYKVCKEYEKTYRN